MGNLLSMGIKMQSGSLPVISITFCVTCDASNTGKLDIYQSIGGGSFSLVQTIQNAGSYTGYFSNTDQFYCIATHQTRATTAQRGQIFTSQNGSDLYGNQSTASGTLPKTIQSTTTTVSYGNTYAVQSYFGNLI
jgi:hypothetical protein